MTNFTSDQINAAGALPCPWCGGTKLYVDVETGDNFGSYVRDAWQIHCHNIACNAVGPTMRVRSYDPDDVKLRETVETWNRRK